MLAHIVAAAEADVGLHLLHAMKVVVGPSGQALLLVAIKLGEDARGTLGDMRVRTDCADGAYERHRHLNGNVEGLDEDMLVLLQLG